MTTAERQYALVRDGKFVMPGAFPIVTRPLREVPEVPPYAPGAEWVLIENRDAAPFDLATHYRLPPTIEIEGDRVFRTYPIIEKVAFHAKELGISPESFRAMMGMAR